MRALTLRCLLLLAPLLLIRPAQAEDGPVCARASVLQLVGETLHRAGQFTRLDPSSVGEIPGGRADMVRCAVLVRTRSYDTDRAGLVPLERVSVYEYSLELRRNGIFLRP